MSDALARFARRLEQEWLPDFCNHPNRRYPTAGFVRASIDRLAEHDALWFMRAIDEGLVKADQGYFTAARSAAKEQIFWQGARASEPRTITLWIEPIITIGAVARLHHEFGWPLERLGMQSKTWAFDLVGYDAMACESLVCEVKKSRREVDVLTELMARFAGVRPFEEEPAASKERNAYRKVAGIRRSWPTGFWALGPGGYGGVWHVKHGPGNTVFELVPATERDLRYRNA